MNASRTGRRAAALWPEEIQHLVRQFLDALADGLLTPQGAEDLTRALVAGDGEGRLWVVGLETGLFYRWEGSGWERGEPSGRLILSAPEEGSEPDQASGTRPARACPSCGVPPRDRDARFCDRCGTALPEVNEADACRECGASLRSGARFCTRCGASRE